MATMSNGTTTWTYTYDSDGLRTGRTNGTTTYTYVYSGSQLSWMTVGDTELQFTYDANGRPLAVVYNGTVYYYALNLQGDVVAILNSSGSAVVYYTYDAWGNILSSSGSMDTTLGLHNPLRYRGYVYDSETGLYYLQSRYYNPDWGRFINADVFISTGQGQLGNNMFAYCNNNPANRIDITGMFWSEIWNAIGSWASNIFGAGLTSTATLFKTEASIVPDPSPITITTGAETKAVARKQGDSSKFISLYAEEDLTNPSLSSGGIYLNIDKFTLDISFGLDNLGVSGNITNKGTTASFGAKADISKFKIGFEHSTTTVTDTRIHESYTNVSVSGLWIVALYAFVTTGQVYAVNGP